MTISTVLQTQLSTLSLFLTTPSTRTPTVLLLIASFGSSLHHPVTTFFYLAVIGGEPTSAALSIGTLGFIQSLGGTIGGPLAGLALDKYGPYIPIAITATACSFGCLWRGFAKDLSQLQLGAIFNGVGVNMWTVVLGHLVKSFNPRLRSEVLSGIGVQLVVVQVCGKALFPLLEYGLKNVVGVSEDLVRYRLHMGVCTVFCFYGTVALFWDRNKVGMGRSLDTKAKEKYKQKVSDVFDDDLEEGNFQLVLSRAGKEEGVEMERFSPKSNDSAHNATTLHTSIDQKQSLAIEQQQPLILADKIATNDINTNSTAAHNTSASKTKQTITTIILTTALLLQSLSNTILTVLWPLVVHDRFHMSAQTFGILTFISSISSMGSMAVFPLVERRVGRVKCAAGGFGVSAVFGLLFCICSFGKFGGGKGIDDRILLDMETPYSNSVDRIQNDAILLSHRQDRHLHMQQHDVTPSQQETHDILYSFFEDYSILIEDTNKTSDTSIYSGQRMNKETNKQPSSSPPYFWHVLSAILLQSTLSFLEPSLKSILSIITSSSDSLMQGSESKSSSLGLTMGSMTTVANIGAMIGNIAGTWMYKLSKASSMNSSNESATLPNFFFQDGSLPFFISAALLLLSSMSIWGLDEPIQVHRVQDTDSECYPLDATSLCGEKSENQFEDTESLHDGCCLGLRERDTSHKCD